MKKIGSTNDGRIVVEMKLVEWQAFERLENAVKGRLYTPILNEKPIDAEFEESFLAIMAWTAAKMKVTALRGLADYLESMLDDN